MREFGKEVGTYLVRRSNNIKRFFLLNLFQYDGNLFLDGDCTILQFLTMQVGSISTLDGPHTERALCTRQLMLMFGD